LANNDQTLSRTGSLDNDSEAKVGSSEVFDVTLRIPYEGSGAGEETMPKIDITKTELVWSGKYNRGEKIEGQREP